MKLNVQKCNREHVYSGDLDFETEGKAEWLDIPNTRFASPVKARLHYEILEDDSVEVTGRVSFTVSGLCSRCLEPAKKEYSAEAEGYFSPAEGAEDYRYWNGEIDFDDFIRDTVLSMLEYTFLCGRDCVPPEYKN